MAGRRPASPVRLGDKPLRVLEKSRSELGSPRRFRYRAGGPVRLAGIICAIAAVTVLAGCALRETRDDYAFSRASDGLWGDKSFELIDWNFPTSRNQPPIEAPKRLRLERTAIGVTWAIRNPLPLSDNLAPRDAPPALEGTSGDARSQTKAADRSTAGSSAADREPRAAR